MVGNLFWKWSSHFERLSTEKLIFFVSFAKFISADCEDEARAWLDEVYEIEHRFLDEMVGQKDWEYSTNINEQTAAASVNFLFLEC